MTETASMMQKPSSSSPKTESVSSPSLSPASSPTTDTSVANEDDEKGSFRHLGDRCFLQDKLDSVPSSLVRPGLDFRSNSYYKRHSSFDTPREVPLPSGRLLNEANLSGFPFDTDPFSDLHNEYISPETPPEATVSTEEGSYVKGPQLHTRGSFPSNSSKGDHEPTPSIPVSAHKSSRSDQPIFDRASSSSSSLPLPSLQAIHTLPQIDSNPEVLSDALLTSHSALSTLEDESTMLYSSSHVPPPPPSPPLPVRELSPPPCRRIGALARSRTNRLHTSSGQSSPATSSHSLPIPSPPLLASPIASDGSATGTPRSPRLPVSQTHQNVTFSSVPPDTASTLFPPRSPKQTVMDSCKSPENTLSPNNTGSLSEVNTRTFPSPRTPGSPDSKPVEPDHFPHSTTGSLEPPLTSEIPDIKPSSAPSEPNLRPSYFSQPTPVDARITSVPVPLPGSSSFSNPSTPSPSNASANLATYYRSSAPYFSLDAQGGYAKSKLPRTPSLAQAPPEVRSQMLLGSTRRRMGRNVAPPSPPTILEPQPSDADTGLYGSLNQTQANHPIAVGELQTSVTVPSTPAPSSPTSPQKKPRTRSTPHRPHERFLAKAGLPPAPESGAGYIAVSTHPSNYEIIVRLEGVSLNSITLSVRKRRVLHLAADIYADGDSAGNGSGRDGHWERRISFGWDADLSAVRAEFDGRFLKVTVPRKLDDVA